MKRFSVVVCPLFFCKIINFATVIQSHAVIISFVFVSAMFFQRRLCKRLTVLPRKRRFNLSGMRMLRVQRRSIGNTYILQADDAEVGRRSYVFRAAKSIRMHILPDRQRTGSCGARAVRLFRGPCNGGAAGEVYAVSLFLTQLKQSANGHFSTVSIYQNQSIKPFDFRCNRLGRRCIFLVLPVTETTFSKGETV